MVGPDGPMRTINPGEELIYRFRAEHSGIWLYHCATAPMAVHIAAGMFGAVVIDPPSLAAVDAEYLMVQSDAYLGDGEVDAVKVAAGTPDLVMFNAFADQYVHRPLHAEVGDRLRIWVLDAGPNESVGFHIVGTQFDTVYKEGAYLLRAGDPDSGGSQVLDLAVAQGVRRSPVRRTRHLHVPRSSDVRRRPRRDGQDRRRMTQEYSRITLRRETGSASDCRARMPMGPAGRGNTV